MADSVMELLDGIKDDLARAKADAHGPRNDAAILGTARAVTDLEVIVRTIVKAYRGDERAAQELKGE